MSTRTCARLVPATLVAGLALSATACLVKETRSTLYVEADETVTWTIVEAGVRSDRDGDEGRQEEEEYLAGHRGFAAAVPLALAAAGGRDVRSDILRDRVPFVTRASARFASLEALARGYCQAAGVSCETSTSREGDRVTWRWELLAEPPGDNAVDALGSALGELHVVFAAARPVEATGFRIEGHGAVFDPPDEEDADRIVVSLTWETGAGSRRP